MADWWDGKNKYLRGAGSYEKRKQNMKPKVGLLFSLSHL